MVPELECLGSSESGWLVSGRFDREKQGAAEAANTTEFRIAKR
jgi:hypothetical protein